MAFDEFLAASHPRCPVLVAPEDVEEDDQLNEWVQKAETFVETMTKKQLAVKGDFLCWLANSR